uniref:ANK_REP_REGION domain-containing protein n=1 Tax=Ditylenchus dipsaci TaxID=166011 RepID=A0A915CT31_9BILA
MSREGETSDEASPYPLHQAVFENNVPLLNNLLNELQESLAEKINELDQQGRSPIMLATVLNHVECAEMLLKAGADANSQNKDMWCLSHEAIAINDFDYLKQVLHYRDYQRAQQTSLILLELKKSLKDSDDFFVEMHWEFTSWLRFIKNMCPSDTYKIYKSGSNIRIDASILDFESKCRWKKGNNQSFIFRFTDDENAEIIFANVQVINLNRKPQLEDFEPLDDVVAEKLVSPTTTTYIDVDNIGFERSKSSGLFSWIGSSDKEEEVEGYTCRVFNASNVEIVTKTRVDHLSEESKTRNAQDNNKPMSFLGLFEKKKADSSKDSPDQDQNDIYGGLTAKEYLSSPPENTLRIGKKKQEVVRSNAFNASLWLAETFPLNLREQIFPVIDLMAVRNAKFSRLKSFIQLQLPSGFPVRITQVTFCKVNEPPAEELAEGDPELDVQGLPVFRLNPSLFQVPDNYKTHQLQYISTQAGGRMYNAVDIDDDYVYLLERFMAEDSPESSNYRQQMQFAIEESIAMASQQQPPKHNQQDTQQAVAVENISDADEDLERALKISQEEEQKKRGRGTMAKNEGPVRVCRNEPGTNREEWCRWKKFNSFDEMDSTLNVQQWIQQCILIDFKDVDTILNCPKGVEEGVWKYEHLRQFCMELNGLAVLLQVSEFYFKIEKVEV